LLHPNPCSYPKATRATAALASTPLKRLLLYVFTLMLVCLAGIPAHGDVGVVLNESLDTSVARITGSGHSAVYFSRICPESPVKLRLCRDHEQGSVMSNYTTLGEDQPFEWNVVPLNVYLYGVENSDYRPLVGSQQIKRVLEERYRENYLGDYCASESCQTSNKAEWREMVGATLERSMYMFVVQTTVEQDRHLIEQFNSLPNENHFNGMTRNCADFTRRVINAYFPGATGPDYINDFGMTSPKAIARSFTRYAKRHPEARFRVLHFAQIPGTIKRSSVARTGTEQLFRSKKLLVPMLIFADHVLPFVAASYIFTGRFNPQREHEARPTVEATELDHQIQLAKSADDSARAERLEAERNHERVKVVGSGEEWKKYHEQFNSIVAEAAREDSLPRRGSLHHFLRRLDDSGTPVADHNGALWIELSDGGESSPVGLSASNIFSSSSDRKLADQLLLARIGQVLKSPKHSRETMVEFKNDWNLLRSVPLYSAEYRAEYRARNGATGGANRGWPGAGHAVILLTRR
jgi:hypothetical protein